MSIKDGRFELTNGRNLGFAEYGDENGFPILFFHGTPNSRLSRHPDISILENLNIRLITLERPGYGLSDAVEERTVLEWSEDVKEFIEYNGIDKFSILSVSGGAPYALSCTYKLDNVVEKCGIVSGFAPIDLNKELTRNMSSSNKIGFWMAMKAPWLLKVVLKSIAKSSVREPEKQLDKFMEGFSISDQNIVKKPEIHKVFLEDMKEAYRQGMKGHYGDLKSLIKPWGFALEEIKTKVYIWQGEEDKNVPIEMGYFFDKALPNSEVYFYPEEGHLLYLNHWKDILEQLKPY